MAVFGVVDMGLIPIRPEISGLFGKWLFWEGTNGSDSWYETRNGNLGGRDKPESYKTRNFGSSSKMACLRVGIRVGIRVDIQIRMVIQIF